MGDLIYCYILYGLPVGRLLNKQLWVPVCMGSYTPQFFLSGGASSEQSERSRGGGALKCTM